MTWEKTANLLQILDGCTADGKADPDSLHTYAAADAVKTLLAGVHETEPIKNLVQDLETVCAILEEFQNRIVKEFPCETYS